MKIPKFVLVCWAIVFICTLAVAVNSQSLLEKAWAREAKWGKNVEDAMDVASRWENLYNQVKDRCK